MTRTELVAIESSGAGGPSIYIDRPTNYEITNDLTSPSEARIEMGDNGTWSELKDAIKIGRKFRVAVNNRPLLTGRMLMRGLPITPEAGATVQLTIRTKLADAAFTSADPFSITNATLKDVILKAYEKIGITEKDFIFNADVARDLMTGRGKNTSRTVQLENLKQQDAAVQPPETIYSFADRHLRRFSLLHWDAPDGRIVVGKPDDTQVPTYFLQCMRNTPRGNNLLTIQRSEDYEQVPSAIGVYGMGGKHNFGRSPISATLKNSVLSRVGIVRDTFVMDENLTTAALAEARARREMAMRSLNADSWEAKVRGFCYRDRNGILVPWSIDTVADLIVDTASPVSDNYFIWRVVRSGNPQDEHTTQLTLSARGVWDI